MSYRLYIAKRAKLNNDEIDSKVKNLIQAEIAIQDIVDELGFKDIIQLGSNGNASYIHTYGQSYFNEENCFMLNIPYKKDDDIDGMRIVRMTKEMVIDLFNRIYDTQYQYYDEKYKEMKNDPELGILTAEDYFYTMASSWKRRHKIPYSIEKLEMPYQVRYSETYLIEQLIYLYNDTDWKTEDVIIYGF